GLLWVEQGRAHQELGVGGGHASIAAALESEVGQVTGGERGRLLVASAEERRAGYFDKRDKPRAAYREAMEAVGELEAGRVVLADELGRLEDKVEALARCKEALERHTRENRLERAGDEVAAARRAVEAARGLVAAAGVLAAELDRRRDDQSAALEAR